MFSSRRTLKTEMWDLCHVGLVKKSRRDWRHFEVSCGGSFHSHSSKRFKTRDCKKVTVRKSLIESLSNRKFLIESL